MMLLAPLFLASAATPMHDPCTGQLARIEEVGAGLGYTIHRTSADLSGSLNRTQLAAVCSPEHVQVELTDERGGRVLVELSALGYELAGEFPGVGSVAWAAIPDGASANLSGFLHFAAATDLGLAFAEYDFAGSLLAASGDAESANQKLAPLLSGSPIWKHAQHFAVALTQSGLDVTGRDAVVYKMGDVAVPAPGTADTDTYKKDCLTMTGTCALAIFWSPVVVACAGATIKCFSAVACHEADCSGDGKG